MVLCGVSCIQNITDYLEVSALKFHVTENNVPAVDNLVPKKTIEGFSTIVQALVSKSKYKDILGNDEVTKALCKQWLEYAAVCVNYADNANNVRRILQELNLVLRINPYITGVTKTIADVALFYALHMIMSCLTNPEKAEFVNVSRWFDNLQQDIKIRHDLELINFNVASLYL